MPTSQRLERGAWVHWHRCIVSFSYVLQGVSTGHLHLLTSLYYSLCKNECRCNHLKLGWQTQHGINSSLLVLLPLPSPCGLWFPSLASCCCGWNITVPSLDCTTASLNTPCELKIGSFSEFSSPPSPGPTLPAMSGTRLRAPPPPSPSSPFYLALVVSD